MAESSTVFPDSFRRFWQKAETAFGTRLDESNPVRRGVAFYLESAGIEAGYGFFAPNVPSSFKLVFEVHHGDGRVEYALPSVGGVATGMRLNNLFDYIAQTRYDALRVTMLKMLAYSIWREHPDATVIRTVFGVVVLPSAREIKEGGKESYEFLYAYDFSFSSPAN